MIISALLIWNSAATSRPRPAKTSSSMQANSITPLGYFAAVLKPPELLADEHHALFHVALHAFVRGDGHLSAKHAVDEVVLFVHAAGIGHALEQLHLLRRHANAMVLMRSLPCLSAFFSLIAHLLHGVCVFENSRKDASLSMISREKALYSSLVQNFISSVFLLPILSTLLMGLDGRL